MAKKKNQQNKFLILLFFLVVCVAIGVLVIVQVLYKDIFMDKQQVIYIPLGDSYTIGQDVENDQNFPTQLTRHLKKDNINIKLLLNPAVSGYTSRNIIDEELPVFEMNNPHFTTILVGANDIVQGVDRQTFQRNLRIILDRVEKVIGARGVILLTIPDFTVTPFWKKYYGNQDAREQIDTFNSIIAEEALERNIALVDITKLSESMESDSSLYVWDGLHPSGKEYTLWKQKIYPVMYKILSSRTKEVNVNGKNNSGNN